MKGSLILSALEDGKRITNSLWPEGHYWEMRDGKVVSVGDGKTSQPDYTVNDLFDYGGWKIVPKYISFGDAMKAIEQGKDVVCDFKGELITINSYNNKVFAICENNACVSGGGAGILIAWIVAGKWLVKENKHQESINN